MMTGVNGTEVQAVLWLLGLGLCVARTEAGRDDHGVALQPYGRSSAGETASRVVFVR